MVKSVGDGIYVCPNVPKDVGTILNKELKNQKIDVITMYVINR